MKNSLVWFKSVCLTLAALFLVTVFPVITQADTSNYTYRAIENGIMITGYNGEYSSLIIPQEIDGQAVTGIDKAAFSSSTSLTGVVIPESVTIIEDNAFSNCPNLVSVRFLGDAPVIGEQVFGSCSSKLKIYYEPGKNGFTSPLNGITAEAYFSVTGIALDKTSAALMVGKSLSLLPTISPAEATNKKIFWTSSNTAAAAVDASGRVSAVGEGNATITATTEDGEFSAACIIYAYNLPAVPTGEFAAAQNYDGVKVVWNKVLKADGYEVYRLDQNTGEYLKAAAVQASTFNDSGLKNGTVYNYKVRAYRIINDLTVYSDFTPVITVKTLNNSIGSTLFLYMSNLDNRNSVFARAVALHYGDPTNTCAYTASEALRRIEVSIPDYVSRTGQVEEQLTARGWRRETNLNLLQPGDICFTTDAYGRAIVGTATHTFIFMGWANKENNLMTICDNQVSTYGSVLHNRTIFRTNLTDATAYFYHTDYTSVGSIFNIPSAVNANPIAYNKIGINWQAASGANGYEIYKSTYSNGSYQRIGTTESTSFADSAVSIGKTYYYKVRAYKLIAGSKVFGSFSNISSATTAVPAPGASLSSISAGKARLSWGRVSGVGGYEVYRATSINGAYTRTASTSSTSYTNSGLVRGKSYYYKVRAYVYIGKTKYYSGYSNIIAVKAP